MTNRPAYWDTLTEDERGDYDAYDPFKEKGNGKDWTKPHIGEEGGLVIVRAADVGRGSRLDLGRAHRPRQADHRRRCARCRQVSDRGLYRRSHHPARTLAARRTGIARRCRHIGIGRQHRSTWVPRLIAAGADLDRAHFVKMVIDEQGKRRTFNLQSDLEKLGEQLNALQKPNW